jgi:hypothetical protein
MPYDRNRLLPIEWFGSILWTVVWGSLAYIAITERSITVVGKLYMGHLDGIWAVIDGFASLGVSLLGVSWLLRVHPFKRLLQLILFMGWLCSTVTYFAFFYP